MKTNTKDAATPRFPYLDQPTPRKQKGGTRVAAGIETPEQHRLALADPDLVRPSCCERCGERVHVHERRARVLRGETEGPPATEVLIFRCLDRAKCGAVWRILPVFLAGHLWRRWPLVAKALGLDEGRHRVPRRTLSWWWAKLAGSAATLVAVLDGHAEAVWRELSAALGVGATRAELVAAAPSLEGLALALHQATPGVRVM